MEPFALLPSRAGFYRAYMARILIQVIDMHRTKSKNEASQQKRGRSWPIRDANASRHKCLLSDGDRNSAFGALIGRYRSKVAIVGKHIMAKEKIHLEFGHYAG